MNVKLTTKGGEYKLAKSEKLFDMLQRIVDQPGQLKAAQLAKSCGVSQRGIYRYLKTLVDAGIEVSFEGAGYVLKSNNWITRICRQRVDYSALKTLVELGIATSDDKLLQKRGLRIVQLLESYNNG